MPLDLNSRTLSTKSPEDSGDCLRARPSVWSLVAIFFFLMNVCNRKTCFQEISNDHLLISDVQLVVMRKDILTLVATQRERWTRAFFPQTVNLASAWLASGRRLKVRDPREGLWDRQDRLTGYQLAASSGMTWVMVRGESTAIKTLDSNPSSSRCDLGDPGQVT